MKAAFEIIFAVFLVFLPASIFYWYVFRPVVLTRLKYRIYAARDQLRLLAVQKQVLPTEKAFPILDVHCNNCLAALSEVSFVGLIRHKSDPAIILRAEKDFEIVEAAGPELRRIKRTIHEALVGALVVNSPVFAVLLLMAMLLLALPYFWFSRAKQWANEFWKVSWGLTYAAVRV